MPYTRWSPNFTLLQTHQFKIDTHQGSMVREWVKWDYELRPGVDLEGVVDRALVLACSEPQGPVYLTLPREVIAEERAGFTYSADPRMTPPRSVASAEAIQRAACVLAQA